MKWQKKKNAKTFRKMLRVAHWKLSELITENKNIIPTEKITCNHYFIFDTWIYLCTFILFCMKRVAVFYCSGKLKLKMSTLTNLK